MLVLRLSCAFLFALSFLHSASSADLKASLGYIPKLAESPDKGAFVDLVKAMNTVYPEGNISIEVSPFARSLKNVEQGIDDFHVPMMLSPYVDVNTLPYRFVKKPMGKVCHVIYSRRTRPVTNEMIKAGQNASVFPYKLEVIHGAREFFNFPFPVTEATYFEDGMLRVQEGRSDGFIAAQEEGDFVLNQLKDKHAIHRALLGCWDDLIVIPKGAKGDVLDRVLTTALTRLESSGRLQKLRSKIHAPYSDWQPQ